MKNPNPSYLKQGLMMMALLGGMFLQTGCMGVSNSLNHYSGETLYVSAIESDGDLLSMVPGIQEDVQKHLKTEKQEQTFADFQQAFMTRLIDENAAFVDQFYDDMHSNDREKIDKALADAGEIMEDELQKLVGDKDLTAENVVHAVLKKEGIE